MDPRQRFALRIWPGTIQVIQVTIQVSRSRWGIYIYIYGSRSWV